jgi:hypothetical protein
MPRGDLADAFETFQESAWRLASLDVYDVPEESAAIEAWMERGELIQAENGWPELVRAQIAAGKSMGRVQVVTRPMTDYMTYLLASYASNAEAGEEIRLAFRDRMPPDLAEIREDFWLFDDAIVFVMDYDSHGAWRGAVDDSEHLDRYLDLRERLTAVSRQYNPLKDAVGH